MEVTRPHAKEGIQGARSFPQNPKGPSPEDPIICKECGKSFKNKSGLSSHLLYIHRISVSGKLRPVTSSRPAFSNTKIKGGSNPTRMCHICDRSFSVSNFRRHVRSHSGIRPPIREYSCSVCSKVFNNSSNYKRHLGSHLAKTHKCGSCGKSFASQGKLEAHLKVHINNNNNKDGEASRPFKCELCSDKAYTRLEQLEAHIVDVHVVDKEFECSVCSKTFMTESERKSHFRKKHEHKAQSHGCEFCESSFRSLKYFKNHLLSAHSRTRCDLCLQTFPSQEEFQSHAGESQAMIPCSEPFCPLFFDSACLVFQHLLKSHREEEPEPPAIESREGGDNNKDKDSDIEEIYQCYLCERSFFKPEHLFTHERLVHAGAKWPCKRCSEVFTHKWLLNRHRKEKHVRIPRFGCDLCFKVFNTEHALKSHAKTHNESEKTLKCPSCPKAFLSSRPFKQHLANSHGVGEKQFKCPHCPASFFGKSQLERNHIPIHFQERPFSCEYCPKRFKTINVLGQHLRLSRCPGKRKADETVEVVTMD